MSHHTMATPFFFELEENCFTMLCWFLPYSNTNQSRLYIYMHSYEVCVYIYPFPLEPPSPVPPPRSSQSLKLSSLCDTAASHQAFCFTHGSVCVCQCSSLSSSHPLFPLLCPQVRSPCLHLHSFPANRFLSTIFLDSICMH